MPNFLCKHCESINQVPPDVTHFTCKKCGVKQVVPSYSERVENDMLNDIVLSETPTEGTVEPYISTRFADFEQSQQRTEEKEAAKQTAVFSKQFADFDNAENRTGEKKTAKKTEAAVFSKQFAAFDRAADDTLADDAQTDETTRKNSIYEKALSKMGGDNIELHREALALLEKIRGWRDTQALIAQCEQTIDRLSREQRLADIAEKKRKKRLKLTIRIGVPILTVLAIFAGVFFLKIYPEMRYNQAVAYAESGKTVQAYEMFFDLNGYRDSRERAAALYDSYKSEKIATAIVGDTVYFGTYEQDGDAENGKEDIAWLVLEKSDDKILLCARYGLDYQKYSEEKTDTTWETSDMRQWLNSTFVQEAFTEEEAAYIALTDLPTDSNPEFDTAYGNATKDKVFLLSIAEVQQYFPKEENRLIAPTDYAVAQGVYKSKKMYAGMSTCCWLLRTPGNDGTQVAYVYYDGALRYLGASVSTRGATFRPTMWIRISN